MALGIDVGTSQRALDFGLARRLGYESCYVKLGGDNVGRYVAPYYAVEVDRARAAGMRVGHYWVPSSVRDPVSAADFFVNNLRRRTPADFYVLDNESLDGARLYSDSQAAQWVNRVKARLGIGGRQVKVYLGLADARAHSWPALLATGCDFIIAAYSYKPFTYPLATIPASRNSGHQYSSSGNIGGVVIDLNSWKPNAFDYGGAAPAVVEETPIAETPVWRQYMASGIGYFCKQADGSVDYALAGNGVGPAAWIPLGSGVAQKVAAVVGSFIELSPNSWVSIKARYEATPEVGSVSATVDLAPLVAAIQALPAASAAELAKRLAG